MVARRPKGTGRKKVEIQPIESKDARAVCFSKRRMGLFNKARELSILCGAEVAAIVFSPWGKPFSFGSPSVEIVLDRFCTPNSSEAQDAEVVYGRDGDRNLALQENLNRELGELRAQLTAIKAQKKANEEYFAKARAEGNQAAAWLEPGTIVSQMAQEDLAAFAAALEKVRAAARASQVVQEMPLFGLLVHGGGGGGVEVTQRQQMMMPAPTGFAAGTKMMMPAPTGFAARTEMIQQQQQMMAMPPPTGFDAEMEMILQQLMMAIPPQPGFPAGMETTQQQQMMMAMPPPPTRFNAGMEMMPQQQQMMMAMPPPPTWFATGSAAMQQQTVMGFGTGMETQHQGFGHGFFPW